MTEASAHGSGHRVGLATQPAPPPSSFEDFTEAAYAALLEIARRRFSFQPFGTASDEMHVLWRHDVDVSMHRALALARIEAGMGLRSTWFLSLHSPFYNLLETTVSERAKGIFELGHWLGLHFDVSAYPGIEEEGALDRLIKRERGVLEDWLERPVTAVSFHNPDVVSVPGTRDEHVGDLPNAFATSLEARYLYVSDSNGYWRFRRLEDVLVDEGAKHVHVLTHPEWWQREPLSPRARLARSAEGRASEALRAYDAALQQYGRINVR